MNAMQSLTVDYTNRAAPSKASESFIRAGALAELSSRRGNYTLTEVFQRYMLEHQGRDASLPQRIQWWCNCFADTPLSEIDTDSVCMLVEELKTNGPRYYCGRDWRGTAIFKAKGKRLKPATVNRYVAALSALLTYASKRRLTPKGWDHPCRGIGREREDNAKDRYLSIEERKSLLSAARESSWDKLYLLVLMAVVTGARKGDLLGLRWEDIDLQNGRATVHRTKNGDPRVLPLTDPIIEELTRLKPKSESGLVFESRRAPGKAFNPDAAFKVALTKARIKNFRFHDLRHTCATYLALEGTSDILLANLMGHRTLAMTRRYTHYNVSDKAKVVNKILGHIS
jgi:integrase